MTTTFVAWLTTQMEARGWTQADLARHAKLGRATINRVLTGDRNAGPAVCAGIARAFDMPVEEVYRIAGLLPPDVVLPFERDASIQELLHILRDMDADERRDIADYAAFRFKQRRRQSR